MKTPKALYINSGTPCPKCEKRSTCGCSSCDDRRKMPRQRNRKFVNGDYEECPYCREISHCDSWMDEDYKDYKEAVEIN